MFRGQTSWRGHDDTRSALKSKMDLVKENYPAKPPMSEVWLWMAMTLAASSFLVVVMLEPSLPESLGRDAPLDVFSGDRAYEHLVNLTSLGPRVAGGAAARLAAARLAGALRGMSRGAPHHRLEVEVTSDDGAFSLDFLDGMNSMYWGVQSVVARLSPLNAPAPRQALLLNCHYDTVPDSPGASDDAAGCAVALETLRALGAGPPLRHAVLLLLNGAEESIMTAAHAFVTKHRWARAARTVVNLEACGAGGREVLFQVGPRHARDIMETYAAWVPRPHASSLAEELFRSGAVPADTDYRVFRDVGGLTGVDLAWTWDGYVYHTPLDVARPAARAVLQRAGDNVLALARGLLSREALPGEGAAGAEEATPVFFDVFGAGTVVLGARAAAAAAAALLVAALAAAEATVRQTARELKIPVRVGRACAARAALGAAGAAAAGAAAAAVPALLLAAAAPMRWFSRPPLLVPLFAVPALWAYVEAARWAAGRGYAWRGWARGAWGRAGGAAAAGAAAAAAAARGLRAGYLPAEHAAAAAAALALGLLMKRESHRLAAWALALSVASAHSWSVAYGALAMLLPVTGRAGDTAPPDLVVAAAVAAGALGGGWWLLAPALAVRDLRALRCACGAALALALLAAARAPLDAAYSAAAPLRLMLFPVRLREYSLLEEGGVSGADDAHTELHRLWAPLLDANTAQALNDYLPSPEGAWTSEPAEGACERLALCGGAYYLPAHSLLPRGLWRPPPAAPAPAAAPAAPLRHRAALRRAGDELLLDLTLQGPAHMTVIVQSPLRVTRWSGAAAAPAARGDYALFSLRGAAGAARALQLRLAPAAAGAGAAAGGSRLALLAHSDAEPGPPPPALARLLRALPPHVTHTGWPVDAVHLRF